MVRYGHGNRAAGKLLLHDDVTALSSDFPESMPLKQPTDLPAREDSQFAQRLSPNALYIPHRADGNRSLPGRPVYVNDFETLSCNKLV